MDLRALCNDSMTSFDRGYGMTWLHSQDFFSRFNSQEFDCDKWSIRVHTRLRLTINYWTPYRLCLAIPYKLNNNDIIMIKIQQQKKKEKNFTFYNVRHERARERIQLKNFNCWSESGDTLARPYRCANTMSTSSQPHHVQLRRRRR